MWKASLRTLLAHKGRLVLSLLAVALSAGFVAGTLIFTDTLSKTFDDLFAQTQSDVLVSPPDTDAPETDGGPGVTVTTPTLPASVLEEVRGAEGVAAATGDIFVDGATIIGSDGDPVGGNGAPTFGVNWEPDERLTPLRLVDGVGPTGAGQVAIDSQSAETGDLSVGDRTTVVTPAGAEQFEVVGIFRFGTSGNLAGATLAAFETVVAQELMLDGSPDFTSVSAAAAEGVTQAEAANSIRAAVGSTYQVQTGEEAADEAASEIQEALAFFNIFLLVFALVSVIVGLFLIFNTFAMIVAQRTRELALFRALGASRGQVRRSVLGEAVLVGLLGAVLGILAGMGLALLLRAAFRGLGLDFPAGSLVIAPRTVLIALVVGLGATVAACWIPSRRAARVSPMAALRDDMVPEARSLRVRTIIGLVLLALSAVAVVAGLQAEGTADAASLIGAGFMAGLLAVVVLAPVLAGPLVRVLGAPFRTTVGRIAVGNALRNRRRTALTATALTLGLALVAAFGTLAVSTADSTDAAVNEAVKADFILSSTTFQPMPPTVATDVAAVPGVGVVSAVRFAPARWDDRNIQLAGVDPDTLTTVTAFELTEGSVDTLDAELADGGVMVDTTTATDNDLAVGDTVELTLATGETATYDVVALYAPSGFFSGMIVSNDSLAAAGLPPLDSFLYATVADGADATVVRAGVDAAVAPTPTVQVQDLTEFKASIRAQINQLLAVIYVLLALSLLVAVLGIVNTLALSVVERTREIGLLRAVGTSRRQLRRMIRIESLVTSVFGAVVGLVLGVFFGQMLVRVLADQGLTVVSTPWVSLAVFLVLAAVVGVLAAAWPAWRASRMNVLEAIATE